MSVSERRSAFHSAFLIWTNSSPILPVIPAKVWKSSLTPHNQIISKPSWIFCSKGTWSITSLCCLHCHPDPPHAPSDATFSLNLASLILLYPHKYRTLCILTYCIIYFIVMVVMFLSFTEARTFDLFVNISQFCLLFFHWFVFITHVMVWA